MADLNIIIPIEEYNFLNDQLFLLECLENAGVDNWEGYEDAMEMYNADKD